MIQLTKWPENVPMWINPHYIIGFYYREPGDGTDGATYISIVDGPSNLKVLETPEQILALLNPPLPNMFAAAYGDQWPQYFSGVPGDA